MTYKVLVTRQPDNRYTARALVLPDIVASGETESEAVEQLRTTLAEMQTRSRLVDVDLPPLDAQQENPWRRFAGMWVDDPDWDAFQKAVEEHRRTINAQMPPE